MKRGKKVWNKLKEISPLLSKSRWHAREFTFMPIAIQAISTGDSTLLRLVIVEMDHLMMWIPDRGFVNVHFIRAQLGVLRAVLAEMEDRIADAAIQWMVACDCFKKLVFSNKVEAKLYKKCAEKALERRNALFAISAVSNLKKSKMRV